MISTFEAARDFARDRLTGVAGKSIVDAVAEHAAGAAEQALQELSLEQLSRRMQVFAERECVKHYTAKFAELCRADIEKLAFDQWKSEPMTRIANSLAELVVLLRKANG